MFLEEFYGWGFNVHLIDIDSSFLIEIFGKKRYLWYFTDKKRWFKISVLDLFKVHRFNMARLIVNKVIVFESGCPIRNTNFISGVIPLFFLFSIQF